MKGNRGWINRSNMGEGLRRELGGNGEDWDQWPLKWGLSSYWEHSTMVDENKKVKIGVCIEGFVGDKR